MPGNAFPWHLHILQKFLSEWNDQFVQQYDLSSYYHDARKIKQTHRTSLVALDQGLRSGSRQKVLLEKSTKVSPTRYSQLEAHFRSAAHLGRRMRIAQKPQSASTLGDMKVLGTGTSPHAKVTSRNCLMKPKITWILCLKHTFE